MAKTKLRPCVHVSMCPCVHVSMCPCVHVSMCPCVHVSMCPCVHVSMCPCVHVSMCPCVHVSMCPCVHVSMCPCVHVSMCPCVHVSMCPCVHVSMCPCVHVSMCPCVHVSMCPCVHVSMCPCVHVPANTPPPLIALRPPTTPLLCKRTRWISYSCSLPQLEHQFLSPHPPLQNNVISKEACSNHYCTPTPSPPQLQHLQEVMPMPLRTEKIRYLPPQQTHSGARVYSVPSLQHTRTTAILQTVPTHRQLALSLTPLSSYNLTPPIPSCAKHILLLPSCSTLREVDGSNALRRDEQEKGRDSPSCSVTSYPPTKTLRHILPPKTQRLLSLQNSVVPYPRTPQPIHKHALCNVPLVYKLPTPASQPPHTPFSPPPVQAILTLLTSPLSPKMASGCTPLLPASQQHSNTTLSLDT